jgi:chromosome segregation ATPase
VGLVETLKSVIEQTKEKFTGFSARYRELMAQKTQLDARITELEGDIRANATAIQTKEREKAALQQQLETLGTQLSTQAASIQEQERQITTLREQVRTSEAQTAEKEVELVRLEQEKQQIAQQLQTTETQNAEQRRTLAASVAEKEAQIATLQRDIRVAKQETKTAKGQIMTTQQTITSLKTETQKLQKQKADLLRVKQKEIDDLIAQYQTLEVEKRNIDRQNTALKSEIEGLRQKWETCEEGKTALEAGVREQIKRIEELNQDLALLQ